jgi:hypothetical protein
MYKIFLTIFCFLNFTFLFCQEVRTRWSVGLDALALTPLSKDIYGEVTFNIREYHSLILGIGAINYDLNKFVIFLDDNLSSGFSTFPQQKVTKNLSFLMGYKKSWTSFNISPAIGGGFFYESEAQLNTERSRLFYEDFDSFYFYSNDFYRRDFLDKKTSKIGLFQEFSLLIKLTKNIAFNVISRNYISKNKFEDISYVSNLNDNKSENFKNKKGESNQLLFRPFQRIILYYNF